MRWKWNPSKKHKMLFDLAVSWWDLVLNGMVVYLITLGFLRPS